MRSRPWYVMAAGFAVFGVAGTALAALLGVLPGFPLLTYDSNGTLAYVSSSQDFSINASPIAIRFSPSTPPRLVTPTGMPPSEVVRVNIKVDASGAVISGVAGDDLVIEGQVDQNGDSIPDYTGILLTGEIIAFGFEDTGTPTDQYDFRFILTGGQLASFYAGKDIGMTTVSENSNFVNNFNLDIAGGAKGSVGPIDRVNTPPFCNANGPYAAECAGTSTSLLLDGSQSTDEDGNALTYSWATNCPGGSFDDPTSATPTLTIDTSNGCNVSCEVTLTVSDGISPPEHCTATVTVSDTNSPSISCPGDLSLACGSSTDPADTGTATASDDCDSAPTVTPTDVETPGRCAQEKTITRTWTASDSCGNTAECSQTITLIDSIAPVILTCPCNVSVTCEQGTNPDVTGRPVATDNCDPAPGATFSDHITDGCCPVSSIVTRTWTVSDACGNSATCVQTITLRDTVRPTIECPPDKTIQCNESRNPSNTGRATATDGCDTNPAITYCDDYCGACPKILRRTWRARDDCGNSVTCVQTITIVDTVAPTICCPPNVTRTCGQSIDPCNTGRPNVEDNCDDCPDVWYCDSGGGCCPATVTRTWTARDRCGNTSTCTQTITLVSAGPCPKTPGYWKNHRSAWPVSSMVVGCANYNETQLMHLLHGRNPNGSHGGSDASTALAKFVVATKFNLLNGASPQNIQDEVEDSDDFLCDNPPGCNPRGHRRDRARDLQCDLDHYCNSNPRGCVE